jgi:hypothetical protein
MVHIYVCTTRICLIDVQIISTDIKVVANSHYKKKRKEKINISVDYFGDANNLVGYICCSQAALNLLASKSRR